jgi:transposase
MERQQAQDGYNPIQEAACWLHARRPFFALADVEENARRKAAGDKEIPLSPIAMEVVRRIDALFERSINGKSSEERLQVRQTLSRPVVKDLQIICANSSPSCRGGMTWSRRLITS